MKRSNVLLGLKKKTGDKTSGEGDEDDWDYEDALLPPNKVAVADDNNAYRLFGDRIFCAPQEDILEGTPSQLFWPFMHFLFFVRTIPLPWLSTPELPGQGGLQDVG